MKSWIMLVVTWLIILQTTVTAVIIYELNLQGTTKAQYSTFLKQLRDDIKDPNLHYGGTNLPVIKRPVGPPKFLRVNLKASTGTVSLAVQRSNLYVAAYLAKNNNKQFRAYYFKGFQITTNQLNNLFPEATGVSNQQELGYGESYPQIQNAAGVTRQQAGLGIKKLAESMTKVNGVARVEKDEALFLLIVVQMVGEAARFKYIENLVLNNFDTAKEVEPVPDRVIILENNWGLLSRAAKTANNGVFQTPLVLTSYAVPGVEWRVTTVAEVEIGIFLNVDNNGLPSIIYNNIISGAFGDTY
ncbi:hypothetical protein RND81_04G017000 [Saponaria officinalis]|uniref:rRNA N-glycosylase n=2 Tax=Saponaria officinalis TaxID=3572 RepID=Q2QEH4_SAPOF|nr:saporin-L3 [Saponaria officinalis]